MLHPDCCGLEQTVESKPLPAYPFPERTVLVLGRESSGIPAHILQVGGSGQYTSEPLHMKVETEMNQLLAPCASTLKVLPWTCCLLEFRAIAT